MNTQTFQHTHWQIPAHDEQPITGLDDLHQCICNILNTRKGSDVLRPDFGSDHFDYLDQPFDVAVPNMVREITQALEKWETRLVVESVEIDGIAFPKGKAVQYAEQRPDGSYLNSFKITQNQIRAEYNDTTQPQVILGNALHKGMFQVSTSGNLEIFDNTNAQWLIYSGTDGVPVLERSPDLTANGNQVTTAYWVGKVIKNSFLQNLSNNGWQKLPNGLIMQWGRYDAVDGSRTFSFPIAFNATPFSVQMTNLNGDNARYDGFAITNMTATNFTVQTSNSALGAFMIFAIGK